MNGGFVTQTSTCKVIGGGERTTCLFAHKHQLDVQASVMCVWCVGVCVRMCGVCVCAPLCSLGMYSCVGVGVGVHVLTSLNELFQSHLSL